MAINRCGEGTPEAEGIAGDGAYREAIQERAIRSRLARELRRGIRATLSKGAALTSRRWTSPIPL